MTPPVATRDRTLRFEGGVANTSILASSDGPHVRIALGTSAPEMTPDADVVIDRPNFADRMLRRPPYRRIWLPVDNCWSIEVIGPASGLRMHLETIAVRGIHFGGSVSHLALRFAAPLARVPIDITGAVSAMTVRRPALVPVTVAVRGSVRDLQVDHRSIRSDAGPVELGAPSDLPAPGYDVSITGSVSGARIRALPV